MTTRVTPFVMFREAADAAMDLYTDVLPDSVRGDVHRYGPGEAGRAGSVCRAEFWLCGERFIFADAPADQPVAPVPCLTLSAEIDSRDDLAQVFGRLSEGGEVFVAPTEHGEGHAFCWFCDRFGVSWQFTCNEGDLPVADARVEAVAEAIHDEWTAWSRAVAAEVHPERKDRWQGYWRPYSELPDDIKERDRVWARKALKAADEASRRTADPQSPTQRTQNI